MPNHNTFSKKKFLNEIYDTISIPLYIISKLFISGVFPNMCKIAKVVPIFKSETWLLCNNSRPVSLSNIGKTIEKLIHLRLNLFLETCSSYYPFQFGFRLNFSMSIFLKKIQTQLTDVKYSSGVFFDLRKAFDTVNHDILLKTLHYYSVRGIVNEWFTSSLKNRKQFVSIRDISSAQVISTGVPQGSFLGLLLFYYIYRPLNYHIFMVCHTVSLSSQSHDSFFSSCGFTDFEWIFFPNSQVSKKPNTGSTFQCY